MIARLTDLGAVGLVKDMPDHDLPENPIGWSVALNVRFFSGYAERVPGYAKISDGFLPG